VAFVHVRRGDSGGGVSAVVMHWFEIERKKEKKTCLDVLVEPSTAHKAEFSVK